MLIDHTGLALCDNNQIMRSVGRLAFPVFAFFLAEGVRHTSDVRRYMARMAVLAAVSEVPFDMAVYGSVFDVTSQNVFFTLLMGLIAVTAMAAHKAISEGGEEFSMTRFLYVLGRHRVEVVVLSMLAAEFLRFDYGAAGVAVIILFYEFTPLGDAAAPVFSLPGFCAMAGGDRTFSLPLLLMECVCLTVIDGIIYFTVFGGIELYALLSIIPLAMYSGERGRIRLKYAFYAFYPVHMFIIGVIALRC